MESFTLGEMIMEGIMKLSSKMTKGKMAAAFMIIGIPLAIFLPLFEMILLVITLLFLAFVAILVLYMVFKMAYSMFFLLVAIAAIILFLGVFITVIGT